MASIHPPSPLRTSTIYPEADSPSRHHKSPLSYSPAGTTRREIIAESSRGWSNVDNGLGSRRPLSNQFSMESLGGRASGRTSPESTRIAGAEGGSEAIGERRRQSNSFKTMSTGSLVSNSPFTKRSGSSNTAATPPVPQISGLYSGSYTPLNLNKSPERKVSGGRNNGRKSSGDVSPSTNENEGGPRKVSGGGGLGEKVIDTPPRSASVSPSVPFRPVRNTTGTPTSFDNSSISNTAPAGSTPYKSNWGIVAPRQSSSYAASRKSASVSTSPFINRTPSVISFINNSNDNNNNQSRHATPNTSEILLPEREVDPSTLTTFNSGMGLGIRPGGPLATTERRIAGSSIPPPSTPPTERSTSSSYSPSSALSLSRRGMKGPRAPEGEDSEMENQNGRQLRRKPSAKTVTWATTEEVLEFDVESERSRSSDVSANTSSDNSELGEDRSFEFDEGNSSMGFEEGGSLVVHDLIDSDEDHYGTENREEGDDKSTVEDMMGEIEAFMENVSPQLELSTRSTLDPRQQERKLDLTSLSHTLPVLTPRTVSGTQSIWSDTTTTSIIELEASDRGSDRSDGHNEEALSNFPSVASPTLLNPTSTIPSPYSLPNLPSSSPLIGFAERSASSSTGSELSTSSPTTITSTPFHSTPTKNTLALDSPIPSPFASTSSTPGPTHLSRHASILESEPYGSSLGSVRGSLRGAGKLRQGKERFDEKLKLHQAILAGDSLPASPSIPSPVESQQSPILTPTLSASTNSITFPIVTKVSLASPKKSEGVETEEVPRIIQARAAIKARTATISSGMLTTIGTRHLVGAPLTAEVANGMESPLDRLLSGVGSQFEDAPASAPTTFSSAFPSISSPKGPSRTKDDVDFSFGDGNSTFDEDQSKDYGNSSNRKNGGRKEIPRRRSRSTGDASLPDLQKPLTNKRATMPEAGFARLNSTLPTSTSSFSLSVGNSLDTVYSNSQHPQYKVRETKKIVYANDGLLTVEEVDTSRAWRKKRPSDMYPSMMSDDSKSLQDQGSLTGQVFVSLVEAHFDDLPIPQEPTAMVCWLDNGRQRVPAGTFQLGSKIKLRKEFELSCSAALTFSIELHIPVSNSINTHLQLNSRPPTLPPTPTSPTKSRFLSAFSSPKKKNANFPPPPSSPTPNSSQLLQYLSSEGVAARVEVSFKAEAPKCRSKSVRLEIPFFSNSSSSRTCSGGITIELFHVPAITGIAKADLPKSVEEVKRGIIDAEKNKEVKFEGVLTQLGGDCQTWRRRLMKVIGTRLVPFNEVTKKSYVEIDLSSVISIEDPNAPILSSTNSIMSRSTSEEFDEGSWKMDNSIKLFFKDGESILFFADTKEEKEKWMDVLRNLAGKKSKDAPEWAIALRKQQLGMIVV